MSGCCYILCEDTRVSKNLLAHYKINTPLICFHKFNESKIQKKILDDLKNDKVIGLISDAGTPLISDPGQNLIKECYGAGIKVEAIPGPCSIIQALVLSGFDTHTFQFLGFLPKQKGELEFSIKKMLFFEGTSIAFESARRTEETIEIISRLAPKRRVAVLKEMTKKFEMRLCMEAEMLFKFLKENPLKGEIVLAVEKGEMIDDISNEECIKLLKSLHGLSLDEAIKVCAEIKNISKKELYKAFKIK
jgi:16S rRNA (cytidine1402-2'-O)-methyltransferase